MTTILPEPVLGLPLVPVLGFPPVHHRGWEEVNPTPFRKDGDTRRRHRVGVENDRDFSRPPRNQTLGRAIVFHHTCHPPAHATTVLQSSSPSHREPCCEVGKTEKKGHPQGIVVQ